MNGSPLSPAESPLRIRPGAAISGVLAVIALGVAFAESYERLGAVLGERWLAAALIHSALALVVLAVYGARGRAMDLLEPKTERWAYLPGAAVILGAATLVAVSRQFGEAPMSEGPATKLAWIVWIPLVEELVFRAGIGTVFRRWIGPFWGAWLAATLFALVHAAPTVERLAGGAIGLPVGPFLLGLGCELLFARTGRLWPVVLLHAACNATVAIFALGDPRWLDWLGLLYG